MSKPIAGSNEYTPAEDINDVLQLIVLIKDRPCINPRGTGVNRACAIGYAELEVIRKRLTHAVEKLQESGDFPRPMGAPTFHSGAEQRIMNLIRVRRMTTNEIAERMVLDFDTADRILSRMEKKRLVRYDGFWNLV